MAVTLQESLRAIFYAPFYVALARGAFDAAGVEIRFASSPRPQDAALRLMDGTVDVCWGGPMRVMDTYHRVPGCDIVNFAEVVIRDPFFLLGREPMPDFSRTDNLGASAFPVLLFERTSTFASSWTAIPAITVVKFMLSKVVMPSLTATRIFDAPYLPSFANSPFSTFPIVSAMASVAIISANLAP